MNCKIEGAAGLCPWEKPYTCNRECYGEAPLSDEWRKPWAKGLVLKTSQDKAEEAHAPMAETVFGADPLFPTGSAERKEMPIYSGVFKYFPRAMGALARLSFKGNRKHNGDEPLHWAKGKSTDHKDCVARHLIESGTVDPEDGELHDVKLAWRALANLEIKLEADALGISYDELIRQYKEGER